MLGEENLKETGKSKQEFSIILCFMRFVLKENTAYKDKTYVTHLQ